MIADRHHRDDLAPVEEQGQRPLDDDGGLDRLAVLVDAGDAPGQARVVGVGPYREFLHAPMMGTAAPGCKTARDAAPGLATDRCAGSRRVGKLAAVASVTRGRGWCFDTSPTFF